MHATRYLKKDTVKCFLSNNEFEFEKCTGSNNIDNAFESLIDKILRELANNKTISYYDKYHNYGYKLETEMLISCQFNGKTCNDSHFLPFWDHKYGMCYTFNNNGSWVTSLTGSKYGLKLELLLSEYKLFKIINISSILYNYYKHHPNLIQIILFTKLDFD